MANSFLVVGGGIAGSLTAFSLIEKGHMVRLYDNEETPGSSHIAAGMINPITGRKFVKSWLIDELLGDVRSMYGRIEKASGIQCLYPVELIRAIKSTAMLNDWSAKLLSDEYQSFMSDEVVQPPSTLKKAYVDYTLIKQAYRVDFKAIMEWIQDYKGIDFRNQKFDYSQLTFDPNGKPVYNDQSFDVIIFCEGSGVRYNPHWNWLPFVPARGERLIIHAPDLRLHEVFNDGKIIIPLDNDQYWVGSNYDWDLLEPKATVEGLKELTDYLDSTISCDYSIVDHAAHVRPSSYNRRPFVGRHPKLNSCFILNGLGAKGASLAPYCANQLIGLICDDSEVLQEIDVQRAYAK